MTLKEQARYRSVTRQLAKLHERGWDRSSHPDIEILEIEQAQLGQRFMGSVGAVNIYDWYCEPCAVVVRERRCVHCGKLEHERA